MTKILGLIFTAPPLVESVNRVVFEVMPSVETFNITDDRILRIINRNGKLTPAVYSIVLNYVRNAEREEADAVLVTCSSISPCVDATKPLVSIPVMKIDDPMTDLAVEKAARIGVVATLKSTLEPTKMLLMRKAEEKGKTIILKTELCSGAFEALSSHNGALHDKLVLEGIGRLANEVELIVLAQASMARLIPQLEDRISVPILSSIRSGVEQAKAILGA
jgi:Asp/Glu/hydantoin racemase